MKWYILNVVAGQELNVCSEINELAKTYSEIGEAFVPLKKVIKVVRNKKVELQQKMFPNYVYVNMEMTKESNALIRGIGKVLKFLGSRTNPGVVSDKEVEELRSRIEMDNSVVSENRYEVGDLVKIVEGAFESFTGTVEAVDLEKNILKISVSIFGRMNEVIIESGKVERVV
jgi:transcriptional antiterminator NusG